MIIGVIEMKLMNALVTDDTETLAYEARGGSGVFVIKRELLQRGTRFVPDRIELKIWVESERAVSGGPS